MARRPKDSAKKRPARRKGKARVTAPEGGKGKAGVTAPRGGPAADGADGSRRPLLRGRNPLAYVGQAAAVVGLVSGFAGLVFVFKPDWRPIGRPDKASFAITSHTIRQPVTFRRYLERIRVPPLDLTEEFLGRRGLLVEFDFEAIGFRGERLPMQWELVDAETHERVVVEDEPGGGPAWDDAVGIAPSRNDEKAQWFVWVPAPPVGGTYYVTVTVYQPRQGDVDVPLADFDTDPFPGFATAAADGG